MTIELWSETVGSKPYRVWVGERVDKQMAVYLRWYEGGRARYQRAAVRTVRDGRNRPLERAKEQARAEARDKAAELAGERVPRQRRAPAHPLTLAEGIALAFGPTGPYPLDPARHTHTREARARAEDAMRYMGGGDVAWEDVTPGMVRGIWRRIAKQYGDGRGREKAKKTVIIFYRIARWLQGERPNERFPSPIPGWRGEVDEHWTKLGHEVERHQPRYSPDEVRAMFARGHEADPRLALALALGAELRGGQVIRAMRSDADLTEGAGATGLGTVRIPFVSQRKRAPTLHLNAAERAALDAALTSGFLADLETAYQRGHIADYPLFPGGRLRGGRAVLRGEMKPMTSSTIPHLLAALEAAAGVAHVSGRAWHGLRRAFTDLYPEATSDARLLDHLGGWARGSSTREATYQAKESDRVAAEAAEMRARIRPAMGGREDA